MNIRMLNFKLTYLPLTPYLKIYKMVCCIVLKPRNKCQTLFLNRRKQDLLSSYLESNLSYKPFIFNSNKGTHIFVKKKETYEKIEHILINFFSQNDLNQIAIYNTSLRPKFFRNLTKQTITSSDLSALGWKRFINSFLLQIDPYNPTTSAHSIVVFKRFRRNIKINGTKLQRKFFKKRMKMLRERVSLEAIENLLNFN